MCSFVGLRVFRVLDRGVWFVRWSVGSLVVGSIDSMSVCVCLFARMRAIASSCA